LRDDVPAPYSVDLRDRVAAVLAAEASARGAASRFGISVSTAIRWAQRLRAEGHTQAPAMGGDHRSRLAEHRVAVVELVARQPAGTIRNFVRGGRLKQSGHGHCLICDIEGGEVELLSDCDVR
jgi:transposase